MNAESNLNVLLKNMRPELQKQAYVFLTSPKDFPVEVQEKAVMVARETEGMTVVIDQVAAHTLNPEELPAWAMITITIHSDLNAVGLLAAITEKLAAAGIPVNAVSAYYHDHLFVPWDKREQALIILQTFGNSTNNP